MSAFLQPVTTFRLSDCSSLQLFRSADSLNFITVCLLQSDGTVDECMSLGNANYCTSPSGDITLDTVSFSLGVPSLILRAYDISSTYGAETWYILSPYYDFDPDSFWRIDRIPFDILSVRDVNHDDISEIIAYPDPSHTDSIAYSFHRGVLSPVSFSRQ